MLSASPHLPTTYSRSRRSVGVVLRGAVAP